MSLERVTARFGRGEDASASRFGGQVIKLGSAKQRNMRSSWREPRFARAVGSFGRLMSNRRLFSRVRKELSGSRPKLDEAPGPGRSEIGTVLGSCRAAL